MRTRVAFTAFLDIVLVAMVFSLFLIIKQEPFSNSFHKYFNSFCIFIAIWLLVSLVSNKFNSERKTDLDHIVRQVIVANILVTGISTTIMYLTRVDYYSRMVVFGTIASVTLIELLWAIVGYFIKNATREPGISEKEGKKYGKKTFKDVVLSPMSRRYKKLLEQRESAILVEIDQQAFDYIFSHADIESAETLIVSTTSRFNIDTQLKRDFKSIVNLKRINDIRYLNKFFESANAKLPLGGLFIDFVETKDLRKQRILNKYPVIINYIAYLIDFIVKRLFPKFALTKGIYFFLTRGQNRVLTKAETFGRLYSCGFEVISEQLLNKHLFFVARKVSAPLFPENPTYGPFVTLERVGYRGKTIKVLKLRTMHPYAEYLQEYIYKNGGLEEGGKFKSDFRISTAGKFLRIFWLDELPMLLNWIRGDMKIVGVRPLSRHYFSLYSKELQERRITYKPGLIPPFYVDNPKSLEEIMASEKKYLDQYDRHPFITDIRYFFVAVCNIMFKKYRSK